ncbi:MAG TPA: NAD-dependent epimerase/dehydratase family protein [Stellaceae bacterium]|nr:NAD-dependent epimerase/dehydratase family protein [Stellaceae bacterium]
MGLFLVTGGCGFIGSHLCDALIAGGASVRVLDDLSTGSPDNVSPKATILQGSVSDPDMVEAAMRDVEGCFHLAAIASVERSTRDWLGAHRTNLSGTIAVFDAARRVGRRPIPVVYASSAAVYGDCQDLPLREAAAARPRSAYGADKLGCELHARIAGEVYGVPTVGLRFFNVYGPRQPPSSPYSGVISNFCGRLLYGEPIEIFGDGRQTRDFVFVGDVVTALRAAMCAKIERPAVFNVCSGRQTSVGDLARLVGALCGHEPEIRFRPARLGEIAHSWGDCSLARRSLALPEPIELSRGLEITLSWMANTLRTRPRTREEALPAALMLR